MVKNDLGKLGELIWELLNTWGKHEWNLKWKLIRFKRECKYFSLVFFDANVEAVG